MALPKVFFDEKNCEKYNNSHVVAKLNFGIKFKNKLNSI